MIIQGAQMNYGFMQKLQARQNQGKDLGEAAALLDNSPGSRLGTMASINPAKIGLTPAVTALVNAPGQIKKLSEDTPKTLGETFANEMLRRMGEVTDENGAVKDSDGLRNQLGSTMDWLRERFGDETAAAAAGMIVQATSSGVTEETLGNGMLNVLKFIDRNFGTNAGDSVMARFNSGINQELNTFFNNGRNEVFFDAGAQPQANQPSATQDANTRFFMQATAAADNGNGTDSMAEMQDVLDQLKAELDNTAQLQDLTSQLEEEFNPAQASMDTALIAYQTTPGANAPQFTNVNV